LTVPGTLTSLDRTLISSTAIAPKELPVHRRLFRCIFTGVLSITLNCLAVAQDGEVVSNVLPITRVQAENILANRDSIAESLDKQISRISDPRLAVVLQDVRATATDPSEWRWYSRDHGILLAISVRERLGISAKVEGAKTLADIVRRLINQNGWGNPNVQVVLIEPESPCDCRRPCDIRSANAPAVACNCR
jgi:hypothetical protein